MKKLTIFALLILGGCSIDYTNSINESLAGTVWSYRDTTDIQRNGEMQKRICSSTIYLDSLAKCQRIDEYTFKEGYRTSSHEQGFYSLSDDVIRFTFLYDKSMGKIIGDTLKIKERKYIRK